MEKIQKLIPKNIKITDVTGWSHNKWVGFRLNGLGCSELGTLVGVNEWDVLGKLFYRKIGLSPQTKEDNLAMAMGRILEPIVLEFWQCSDINNPSEKKMLENHNKKAILREAYKPEVYIQNPEYPFLFGSPDGLFIHDGKLAVLEIKTISDFSADKYKDGIPPSYVFQAHGYMLLLNVDYVELAVMKSAREFTIIPINRDEEVIEIIKERGSEFWERVLMAREAISNEDMDTVYSLEPPIEYTNLYEDFLNEKWQAAKTEIIADEEIELVLEDFHIIKDNIKEFEEALLAKKIDIKAFMGANEALISESSSVTWKVDKNGSRRFLCKRKK